MKKTELYTLVLSLQLCAGGEEERVVFFSFVAPTMCLQ